MATPAAGAERAAAVRRQYGRYVLGLGAIFCGGVDLVWRQASGWQQIAPLNRLPAGAVLGLFLVVAAVELAGGVAILAPARQAAMVRAGALALTAAYLVITLLTLPDVVTSPAVFNSWGVLGEELSRLAGAAIAFAMARRAAGERAWVAPLERAAYWAFAACTVTFMIEQWVFFARTVTLVPKWVPPNQLFWAVATTVAFGLAAAALLARRAALLAARLLTVMLVSFAVLVWVPILFAQPHVLSNWTEGAETLSIAGAAWVVSDYLAARRPGRAG